MDVRSYFGDRFFEYTAPEPEQFETFDVWVWRLIHEERAALESVRESLRSAAKTAAPEIPVIPDNVAVNSSVAAAWERFHRSPARINVQRESNRVPARRPRVRELHTLVSDPDIRHLLP